MLLLTLFLAVSSLSGCGSGGGGENNAGDKSNEGTNGSTAGIITGQAIKGPISGGTVTAYAVSDGVTGSALGTAITDSTGNYSLSIKDYNGPVFLEITGGSYTDEATGKTIYLPLTAGFGLKAVVDNVSAGSAVQSQITPLTTMAAARAQNMPGGLTASNILAANQQISSHFGGIDILNTQPINPLVPGSASEASENAINYGLILAGLSQQTKTLGVSNPFDLFNALAQDLSDGICDGKSGMEDVKLSGFPMNPAIGSILLAAAINTFAQDTTRNLSAATASDTLIAAIRESGVINQETWVKTFGGADWELANSVQQTSDGGYILVGSTDSNDGNGDILVMKLDWRGDILWQKSYGSDSWEWASNIRQTTDGGYILAGTTDSTAGNGDLLVMKLNGSGDISWQKSYYHEGWEWPSEIQITSDGGYILTASATGPLDDYTDTLVMKLYDNGKVEWENIYEGNGSEWPSSILQTSDGGYVVAGSATDPADGTTDTWVIKLDEYGNIQWKQNFTGDGSNWPSQIMQTSDEGFIIAGYQSDSNSENGDFWIMKLNSDRVVSWLRAYGGESWDSAYHVYQTSGGGYIVAGSTSDLSGDYGDALVIKLDENGDVEWQKSFGGNGLEEAFSIQQTLDGGYIVVGFTDSIGEGNEDILVLKIDAYGNMGNCKPGMNISDIPDILIRDTSVISDEISSVQVPTVSKVLDTSITKAERFFTPVTWCAGSAVEGKQTYTLTINKGNDGLVVSDPPGINCGYEDDGIGGFLWRSDCTHVYDEGTIVTLIPASSLHSYFSGLTGDDGCSSDKVKLDGDKNCTASFSSRYRLEYVSGDNQTWGGDSMPSPMVFKIFDMINQTYVENGFDGLIMSADGDTGYSDDWCWGCLSDMGSTNAASEVSAYWYVEVCPPLPPYDLSIQVNALDNYTNEYIEGSPYIMHHTISRDDAYCE